MKELNVLSLIAWKNDIGVEVCGFMWLWYKLQDIGEFRIPDLNELHNGVMQRNYG